MSSSKYINIPDPEDRANELFTRLRNADTLQEVDIEVTSRCNLRCRHCYINEASNDEHVRNSELTVAEWQSIMHQVAEMGGLYCTITGGDPLLRKDFKELYLMLKREGFLLKIYTNLTLVTEEIIQLLKEYPPELIESTVYGVSETSYECVTGVSGAFSRFRRNIERIKNAGLHLSLKAMLLRSNLDEAEAIVDFCYEHSQEPPRFDAVLVQRHDGNAKLNSRIRDERLSGEELVSLFKKRPVIAKNLETFVETGQQAKEQLAEDALFTCSAGIASATIGADGVMRPCSLLVHPAYLYDLKIRPVRDAFFDMRRAIQESKIVTESKKYPCPSCELRGACLTCPAKNYLETGNMEEIVPELCALSHHVSAFIRSQS